MTHEIGPWKLARSISDHAWLGFNKDTGEVVSIIKTKFFLNKEIPKSEFLKDYIQVVKTGDVWILIQEFSENPSLKRLIQEFGKLGENLASGFTRNILKGLQDLHANSIALGNLKSENIITRNKTASISEIGIYKCDDQSKDVWDLGIIVLEMMTGVVTSNTVPEGSCLLSDFLSKCFIKNEKERWTPSMLLMHPWITCYHRLTVTWDLKETVKECPKILKRTMSVDLGERGTRSLSGSKSFDLDRDELSLEQVGKGGRGGRKKSVCAVS